MEKEIRTMKFMIIIFVLIISLFVYFRIDKFTGGFMIFSTLLALILIFIYIKPFSEDTYTGKITEPVKDKEEKESKRKKIMLIIAIIFVLGLIFYFKITDVKVIAIIIFGLIIVGIVIRLITLGVKAFVVQIKAAPKLTEDDKKKVFEYMKDNDPSKLPDEETLKRYKLARGGYLMSDSLLINFQLNPKKKLYQIYLYIIPIFFLAIYEYYIGEKYASIIFFGIALIMFIFMSYWYKRIKEGKYSPRLL